LQFQARTITSREEQKKKEQRAAAGEEEDKFGYWDGKHKEGTGNPDENLNGETRNWLWYKFQGMMSGNEELRKSYEEVTEKVVNPLKEKVTTAEKEAKNRLDFVGKPFEKAEQTLRHAFEGTLSKAAKLKAEAEAKQKRHKEMDWDDEEEDGKLPNHGKGATATSSGVEAEMFQAFQTIDKNGSGFISAAELRHIITNLGKNISDEDLDGMICEANKNSDGLVDYKEFVMIMISKQPADDESEFVREAKRRQAAGTAGSSSSSGGGGTWAWLKAELAEAAAGLVSKPKKDTMRTKLKMAKPTAETDAANKAAAEAEEGAAGEAAADVKDLPGQGQLVAVKEEPTAWEKMGERLRHSPLIQQLLRTGKLVGRSPVGRAAGKAAGAVGDKLEDAREAWETSQNPLVYKLSGWYDDLTADTEEALAVREFRRLDPGWDPNEWKADVVEDFLPGFLRAFLRGDARALKDWCGEGVYGKLKQEIRKRKADGLVLDTQVLGLENDEIVAIKADEGAGQPPMVVLQVMAQQVNCVRNREGEVVEGAEDQIRANYYMIAFQREYREETGELVWSVADMMLVGAFPYL